MIINHNKKYVFVHIHKTAGTSISINMLKSGGIKYKNKHSFITELENEYKNYFKFSFVRNPWDRLVSWYNMFLNLCYYVIKYVITEDNVLNNSTSNKNV